MEESPKWQAELDKILDGIDQEECCSDVGWWETSTGAEFGGKKKQELVVFIEGLLTQQKAIEDIGLPDVIIIDERKYYIIASRFPTTNEKDYYWEFDYESVDLCKLLKREDRKSNVGIAENLVDAMLSLKIWLKENGYLK